MKIMSLILPFFTALALFTALLIALNNLPTLASAKTLARARSVSSKELQADGRGVEMSGLAYLQEEELLRSPWTDSPCLWYRARVTQYFTGKRPYESWVIPPDPRTHTSKVVGEQSSRQPFRLRDHEGEIAVLPELAQVEFPVLTLSELKTEKWGEGQKWEGAHRREDQWEWAVARASIPLTETPSSGLEHECYTGWTYYRVEEWIIPNHARLYVAGLAMESENGASIGASKSMKSIISSLDKADTQRNIVARAEKSRKQLRISLTVGGLVFLAWVLSLLL